MLAVELIRQAELIGVAPTSQKLSIKSMTVERVSEGKIIEHWRVTDELDMMRQLGVFAAPREQRSDSTS
jgi:predicted ester cyclase